MWISGIYYKGGKLGRSQTELDEDPESRMCGFGAVSFSAVLGDLSFQSQGPWEFLFLLSLGTELSQRISPLRDKWRLSSLSEGLKQNALSSACINFEMWIVICSTDTSLYGVVTYIQYMHSRSQSTELFSPQKARTTCHKIGEKSPTDRSGPGIATKRSGF